LPDEPRRDQSDDTDNTVAAPGDATDAPLTSALRWRPEGTDLARAFLAQVRSNRQRRRAAARGSGPDAEQLRPGEDVWSSAHPDDRDPQPVGAAVDEFVDQHGWGTELRVHGVMARWDLIVGPDIAVHSHPERYAETELTIRAESTAWATQLRLLAPVIVRRLNEELGDGTVTRIHVLGPTAPSWIKGPRRVKGRGPRDTYG
jgi:predicted nucleic acid-binding Zn ribbon protein